LFSNSFTATQHEVAAVFMKVMMNACHKQICLYKNEFGSLFRSVFAGSSRISSKTEEHVTVPLTVLQLSAVAESMYKK
jgi:hypothetical protein